MTKQPQLTNILRKRRLKWFGHVLRMDNDRAPKMLYLWQLSHGKRRRGRPRTTWRDVIQRVLYAYLIFEQKDPYISITIHVVMPGYQFTPSMPSLSIGYAQFVRFLELSESLGADAILEGE